MTNLIELDSLEILAIVDNELDPISPCPNPEIQYSGGIRDISMRRPASPSDIRGPDVFELRMDNICCSAHGLSLLITGVKDGERRSVLFDTGPEEDIWERNATRLGVDLSDVEVVMLSHWHRDHSGGMLRALDLMRKRRGDASSVIVDLHPGRPDFRGVKSPGGPIVSLEADPSFEEIEHAGGVVQRWDRTHSILGGMFLISGEIPRVTTYEMGFRNGMRFVAEKGEWERDELMADERLLMCKVKDKGIVMFTGCSHAGLVNASKHAVEIGQGSPLYAVVGGFHLADAQPDLIQDTINDVKTLDPQALLAGHCTGWRAKFALESQVPGRLVPMFVGSKFVL